MIPAVEADGLVGERALDVRAVLELHAELGEERDRRVEIADDDGDIVHASDGHGSNRGRPADSRHVTRPGSATNRNPVSYADRSAASRRASSV